MTSQKSLGAILACITIALSGCGAEGADTAQAAKPEKPASPVVVAAEVSPAAPDALIRATGTIVYERETTLSFKTGGIIAELGVDEGDPVKAGQRLARLDLTELAAGLAQAEAGVANADVQYERTRSLVEKGHLAPARLDDAALARDQARANRDAVSFNRNQGVMASSADGVVLRRFAEPGQTVSPGAPVLLVGDITSGLILRVPVSAFDAARLRVKDTAEIRINGRSETALSGNVLRIAAISNAATGNFEVDLSVSDASQLRSGLVSDALITASGSEETLGGAVRIPTLALIDARADQGYVYVIDEKNVAHRRAVATSGVDQGSVLVVSGLVAGERIVAEGAAYVRDGEAVTIADRL